jgi:RNA polymerase sigma-70 factor (ECF subfamily)
MASSRTQAMTREERFAGLVRAHQAGVWRYLRFLGCEPDLAEDLVQEVFLKVWRRPFADRGDAAAGAYLRTAARHLFLSERRRRGRRPAFRDLDAADEAWAEHVRDDDGAGYRDALRRCVGALAGRVRRVLALFYRDGLSRRRVADAVGMTADGVKTTMRRARETLRECIERRLRA